MPYEEFSRFKTAADANGLTSMYGSRYDKEKWRRLNTHLATLGILFNWDHRKYYQWWEYDPETNIITKAVFKPSERIKESDLIMRNGCIYLPAYNKKEVRDKLNKMIL